MSEFVYLLRATADEHQAAMGTPEQAQQSMESMLAWIRGLEESGHMKDPGQPLEPAGKVIRGADKLVTDGPYVEAKDLVLGFIVVEARDLAEAVELAGDCPMVLGGAAVEVRPVAVYPGHP